MSITRQKKVYLFIIFLLGLGLIMVGCGTAQPEKQVQSETKENEAQGNASNVQQPEKEIYKITLAGASPGGLWSLIGEGVSKAMAEEFPGSTVTYETSGGGFANIPMVAKGEVELGIAQDGEVMSAIKGWEPFDKPINDLYALAVIYDWMPWHVIIRQEVADKYGINSLDDIVEKKIPLRISVNQKGNVISSVDEDLFRLYGMPFEEIESWGGQIVYSPTGETAQLMKDRRLDMNVMGNFVRHSSILETAETVDLKLLPIKDSVIKELNQKWGMKDWVIKADSYDWLEEDYKTTTMGSMILVSKDLSEQQVYDITNALVENIDAIQGVHGAMKALTPELMASQKIIPYHPGAVKYYKEKGLM